MKRARVSASLLLTAFFAVAGSYDHHGLPKATHGHAGFCSAEVEFSIESCALCPVAQTSIDLVSGAVAPRAIEAATLCFVRATGGPVSVSARLHRDPRAPPSV